MAVAYALDTLIVVPDSATRQDILAALKDMLDSSPDELLFVAADTWDDGEEGDAQHGT